VNIFNPINNAEDITDVSFGYTMPAVIYGTIWEDNDGDGTRDTGDDGLDNATAGITVTLYASDGSIYTTTQTHENGYYEFSNLPADTYTITVGTSTLPAGATWNQTAETGPSADGTLDDEMTTTVTTGQVSGSHNFGYHRSGATAVGDTLYTDWNGDATQDTGEEGIPDITVWLYEDADGDGTIDVGVDGLISTTVTADGSGLYPAGYYTFTNLAGDNYIVVVDTDDTDFPSDVAQTQDPDETGVCETCNPYGSADTTGGSVNDIDFGYQPIGSGSIGDFVWQDDDGDGVQDAGENGIANITVKTATACTTPALMR
jgi:hypothetical protein